MVWIWPWRYAKRYLHCYAPGAGPSTPQVPEAGLNRPQAPEAGPSRAQARQAGPGASTGASTAPSRLQAPEAGPILKYTETEVRSTPPGGLSGKFILLIPWAFPPGVLSISEGIVLGVVLEGGLRLLPNPLLQTSTRFCNGCAWPPSGAELIRASYKEELGRVFCIL